MAKERQQSFDEAFLNSPAWRGVGAYSGGMVSAPFALYDLGQTAGGWTMSGDWKPQHEGEQWMQDFTGIHPTGEIEQGLYNLGQMQGGAKMTGFSNQGAYQLLNELGAAAGIPAAGLPTDIAGGQQYIDPQTGRYYTNLGSLTNTPYATNLYDLPQNFQGWNQPPDKTSNYPYPPGATDPGQLSQAPPPGDYQGIPTADATWSGGYPWYDASLPSGGNIPSDYQFGGYSGPSGYSGPGSWGYDQPGYGLLANAPQTQYSDVPYYWSGGQGAGYGGSNYVSGDFNSGDGGYGGSNYSSGGGDWTS
jgi:hypothetical protein